MEKLKPNAIRKTKTVLVALSARNEDDSVTISESEKEETLPLWLEYFEEKSVLKE